VTTTETTTVTTPSPTTIVEVKTEYGPITAGVIIALIVGFAVGYIAKKKELISGLIRAVSKPSKPPARKK
jgi:ABC-type glycerol-3-phosphate transport system permease component